MPEKNKHLIQYKKNKDLYQEALFHNEKYFDWKITIIFYAALHLMDSTYADNNCHPGTHETRNKFIESVYKDKQDIINNYQLLEDLSRKSRYKCSKIKEKHVKNALKALQSLEEKLITS